MRTVGGREGASRRAPAAKRLYTTGHPLDVFGEQQGATPPGVREGMRQHCPSSTICRVR